MAVRRPDGARLLRFLKEACARKLYEECTRAGVFALIGFDGEPDVRESLELLEHACERKASQCVVLAAVYNEGKIIRSYVEWIMRVFPASTP